ncbi:unnamed protein product [Periconia digitata]|uniref:EthD domain-containing protein n=1 Tax=Periconia digitata TaxID=1303443 RepID=A0A9W4UB69_9PLEO|nr:unnamed protein product [Periconia digitata]
MSASPTNPAATITCLYPKTPNFFFNVDYYLSTHIPLAKELWGPLGMTGVSVAEVDGESGYAYNITIQFKDLESWKAVLQHESSKRLGEDGKNYTNVEPVFIASKIIG